MQRKKMLFLSADFPLPVASGAQIRQLHLLRSLSQSFEITLITRSMQQADLDYVPELEQIVERVIAVRPDNRLNAWSRLFHKVRYWLRRYSAGESNDRFYLSMPRITRAIEAESRRQSYDIVFAMYWYWDARIWDTAAYKVIDTNDVQWHRARRLLSQSRNPLERLFAGFLWRRYRRNETETLQRADCLVAITDKDQQELAEMTEGRVLLIHTPTGLDTDWFVPEGKPRENQIAFFGAMRNPMNRDAVLHLVEDIWPKLRARRPGLELHLIGAGAPPEVRALSSSHPEIHVSGYVEDIRDPLRKSSIVLLPLRFGWGIRGRVYEVMSLGIPVVATPVAVEGMQLEDGAGIVLASTPDEMIAAVLRLLDDEAWRQSVGSGGRRLAVGTASIAATYGQLTRQLAGRLGAPAPEA